MFFYGPEQLPAEAAKEEEKKKESAELQQSGGLPIKAQVPVKKPEKTQADIDREKQAAEAVAKQKLNEAEQKIVDKYGGSVLQMDKLPGGEEKGYKNEVYVNIPRHPEKFLDKEGKPVPPRVIYYFHGNGGSIGADADNIMRQVEQMRANGENVILVMPQDNRTHWKDFDHPQAFKDLQKMTEQLAGGKKLTDISIASFSGGYAGVEKTLRNLREQASTDPEAKRLYTQINQLGFLDSAYAGSKEFAAWAADKNHTLFSNCTGPCESGNQMLREAIEESRKGDMSGIRFEKFGGVHGNAPLKFSESMRREGRPATAPESAETEKGSGEAMSKEKFLDALNSCRTEEERQRLIISQAAAGELSPDCLTPRYYETTVNGKKVKVKMTGLLAFGSPGNSVSLSLDAYTSQALADMLGGALPTAKFHRQLYDDGNVQKVPFFTGEELQTRVNEKRGAAGLPPLNINVEVTNAEGRREVKRNGTAMESADYMQAESERLDEWLKRNNVPKDSLMVGGRKVVLAPEGDGGKMLTFGGALYTEPVKNDKGEIVDVKASGKLVQGIGDRAHGAIFHDYAQGTEVMTGLIVEGKEYSMQECANNPECDKVRAELFGPNRDSRYQCPAWMSQYVEEYKRHPSKYKGEPVARAEEQPGPGQQPHPAEQSKPAEQPASSTVVSSAPSAAGPASAGQTPVVYHAPSGAPPVSSPPGVAQGPAPASQAHAESPPGPQAVQAPATETAAYQPSLPASGREKTAEGEENPPTLPYTSLGDSFTVGIDSFSRGSFVKFDYHSRMSTDNPRNQEMVGKTTQYMKERLEAEVLPNFEKNGVKAIVLGGGGNDILGQLKNDDAAAKVEESVKNNLSEMYAKCRQAGLKVIAMTMPPFDRYIETRFKDEAEKARHYRLWEAVNNFIISLEGTAEGPDKVVRMHELVGKQDQTGKWILQNKFGAPDGLHLTPEAYKNVSREIEKNINSFTGPATSSS